MTGRALLMIPGPIEFEPEVLQALGAPTTSHVAPKFIKAFGVVLEQMRQIWLCPSGQPFVVAGSGTLAMDVAGANLIEPGDRALVISTGVFGDRYGDLLLRYGARVDMLQAPLGAAVSTVEIERKLAEGGYKVLTCTHVDTSTGVRMDAKAIGTLGRQYGVLTVLDGVCSVAGEEVRQEEWGIDVVLTASQKAIGVPPGLALLVASPQAIAAWRSRKQPVSNYYADWCNWLPIMEAYEARRPSYFGTPAVNLVCALRVSLGQILDEGLQTRFQRHRLLGSACREAIRALGMSQVPEEAVASSTLSAPRYPDGVSGSDLLPQVRAAGAILAGGLHPEIKDTYFRIGHMGANTPGDLLATIGALEAGLAATGHGFELGAGVAAAQRVLHA